MIKLRSRLLVTCVLAATLVVVLGVDIASAARFRAPSSAKSPVRRVIGPCAGEPDNGNNGAPIKIGPTVAGPAGTSWILEQMLQMTWKSQFQRSSRTR
ncbi:MAG: hypothetical protein U0704_17350 [Candidatus Eisenbacteria bacterium]